MVLDGENEREGRVLAKILDLLGTETPEGVPRAAEVRRAKLVFYYPWSTEE